MRQTAYDDKVVVRVSSKVKTAADEILKERGTDMSDYIRECLKTLIKENKNRKKEGV